MRKFLLKLLMGASLTASVFLFQSCYGVPTEVRDIPRNAVESNTDETVIQEDLETVVEQEDAPASLD